MFFEGPRARTLWVSIGNFGISVPGMWVGYLGDERVGVGVGNFSRASCYIRMNKGLAPQLSRIFASGLEGSSCAGFGA